MPVTDTAPELAKGLVAAGSVHRENFSPAVLPAVIAGDVRSMVFGEQAGEGFVIVTIGGALTVITAEPVAALLHVNALFS